MCYVLAVKVTHANPYSLIFGDHIHTVGAIPYGTYPSNEIVILFASRLSKPVAYTLVKSPEENFTSEEIPG